MTKKILALLIAQYQKDKEFFLEKLNRDNFKIVVLESLGINNPKGRGLYSTVYKKFLKKMKLDKYKYSNPRFRPNIPNSEINAKTTEKRSGITEERKSPVEEIQDEFKKEHPEISKTNQQEIDLDLDDAKQLSYHVSEKMIGYFWDGVLAILRIKWKYIGRLKEDERHALGMMWRPFLEKYASEKLIFIGIPAICSIGILFPKIREGRRLSKEKRKQEEKQKEKPKSESKKENKKPTSKSSLVYNEEKRIWEKRKILNDGL